MAGHLTGDSFGRVISGHDSNPTMDEKQLPLTRRKLSERISELDLRDYIIRRLSTKDIAKMYGVTPSYVTRSLPPRAYKNQKVYKSGLRKAREEYRNSLASRVDKKELTIKAAAKQAGCSVRTMFRHLAATRDEQESKNAG